MPIHPQRTITSSGHEVIDSGTVLTFGTGDVVLTLANDFILRFKFTETNGSEENNIVGTVEGNVLILEFRTHRATGFGWEEPAQVGVFQGRQLWLAVRLDAFGRPTTSYALRYSLFAGDKA